MEEPLTIERVPTESLVLDPANARQHGPENMAAIEGSLRRFGQAEPLIVQKATRRVIGGNGRLVAMRRLGWAECDVVELDITDTEAAALGIALNRTGELAAWDEDALTQLIAGLRAEDALDGIGFSQAEIDELLAGLDTGEPVEDAGAPEPPENPVSQVGDLWVLGRHRILCGDSTKADDLARLMAGDRAALLATDPPYLVDYQGGNHPQSWANRPETRDKHWDAYTDPKSGLEFFVGWLRAALPHCAERVAVYQWHAHRRQALVERAWKDAGLLVHQQLIWVKARAVLNRSHYMWRHEPCFYGWLKGSMPPKDRRPPNNATSVWEIDQVGQQTGVHPTQKPLQVFERPIACHTVPGEIVLEPFSGSGTQIIAAERLNRRCYAMELSPAFCDVAVRRWQESTGKDAVLEETGATFAETGRERLGATAVSDGGGP